MFAPLESERTASALIGIAHWWNNNSFSKIFLLLAFWWCEVRCFHIPNPRPHSDLLTHFYESLALELLALQSVNDDFKKRNAIKVIDKFRLSACHAVTIVYYKAHSHTEKSTTDQLSWSFLLWYQPDLHPSLPTCLFSCTLIHLSFQIAVPVILRNLTASLTSLVIPALFTG